MNGTDNSFHLVFYALIEDVPLSHELPGHELGFG